MILGNIILLGGIFGALLNIDMCFSSNFIYWLFSLIIFIIIGLVLIKLARRIY